MAVDLAGLTVQQIHWHLAAGDISVADAATALANLFRQANPNMSAQDAINTANQNVNQLIMSLGLNPDASTGRLLGGSSTVANTRIGNFGGAPAVGGTTAGAGTPPPTGSVTAQPQFNPSISLDPLSAGRLGTIPTEDIFNRFVAAQPFAQEPSLEVAARRLEPLLRNQFAAFMPQQVQGIGDSGFDPAQGNTFQQFLQSRPGLTPISNVDFRRQLGHITDLLNVQGPFEESPFFTGQPGSAQAARNLALRQQFQVSPSGSSETETQFPLFLSAITQGLDPGVSSLLGQGFRDIFNRYRAQNPFGNFLSFARANRFGGGF